MASACEERWQTSKSTVLERNKYMFNNPVISDIKFAFPNHDKRVIPAHKYVLAISSPVFFAMFYGGLPETRETIEIVDCDPDIFLQFLRFLYCDDASFQGANNAIQLWYLADKYDVPLLATMCVNFVDGSMEPLNAFDIIPHARHFNHEELEKCCWEVIDYNAKDIFAHDSFLELKHDFLLQFVKRSSLRIAEVMLFEAVDRWAAKRCEEANMAVDGANKRSVLGEDLLKNVRFPLMSPYEFSDVVMPTEILSTTELVDFVKHFTSAVPIPGGLKFSVLPRASRGGALVKFTSFWHMGGVWTSRSPSPRVEGVQNKRKSGVLTFTVSKHIMLCGIRIITNSPARGGPSCIVKVSVARRGVTIRPLAQKKDKSNPKNRGYGHDHGEIDVFFNRPFHLEGKICYTIESETDTTQDEGTYVSRESHSELNSSTSGANTTKIVSGLCSGQFTDFIPANVAYKGEIMGLFYQD